MKFKKKKSDLGPNADPELYQDVKTALDWTEGGRKQNHKNDLGKNQHSKHTFL